MPITQRTIKILWSAAGGRCAFRDCRERLTFHEMENGAPYTLGEMAHICGDKAGSNRHDPLQKDVERDDYNNLILLCPTHHAMIDRKENEAVYSVEFLHIMKAEHEAWVVERLKHDPAPTKNGVFRSILPLLEENRQVWMQYGPQSDLARNQPHNEMAHEVWLSERLAVIVPNNRKISFELEAHRSLFDVNEQKAVSAFLIHARSYERWVDDSIPYAAVRRFPKEFDDLVRGRTNDCA